MTAEIDKPDLWAWKRNVIPEFKSLTTEQIKAKMRERSFPMGICVEGLTHDFNVSSCFRNANAFGAQAIYYLGEKHLDRRGCCGVQNYSEITHLKTIAEFVEVASRYTIIGVDNIPGAMPIDDYVWPARPMMVYGTECSGLSKEMLDVCKEVVCIEQFGSIPSINVSSASAIVMHDFVSKLRKRAH